jgi:hypothetical protein
MHKDGYPTAVFFMNLQYDTQQDYRLSFLKDQGVVVRYLYNAFDENRGPVHQFLHSLIRASYKLRQKLDHDYQGASKAMAKLPGLLIGLIGTMFYTITRCRMYLMSLQRIYVCGLMFFWWSVPASYPRRSCAASLFSTLNTCMTIQPCLKNWVLVGSYRMNWN